MSETYNVCCVLSTQTFFNKKRKCEYGVDNVAWLMRMLKQHITLPANFYCLSDVPFDIDGVERIPLIHGWPGWWSKLELFRPGLFDDNVFYIDLDMAILHNIDHFVSIADPDEFWILNSMSKNTSPERSKAVNSSMMAWNGDYSYLYDAFCQNPKRYMKEYSVSHKWADQEFINDRHNDLQRFQLLYPGQIMSYLKNYRTDEDVIRCRVMCFHGEVKPQDVQHDWLPKYKGA